MQYAITLGIGLALSVSSGASAQTLLLDLGNTGKQSNPAMFNNIVPGSQTVANAIDTGGNFTGIGISIVNDFFDTGEPSTLGTESPSGDAAQFGVDATDDYFFGHTTPFAGADANPLGVVEFSNLSLAKTYTFTIFASRTGVTDTREAVYEAAGDAITSGTLNASNNDSQVLVLADLVPDQFGVITISAFPSFNNDNANGFFYLGAIRVDGVPAPGSAALIGLGGLLAARRRRGD